MCVCVYIYKPLVEFSTRRVVERVYRPLVEFSTRRVVVCVGRRWKIEHGELTGVCRSSMEN